MSNSLLVILLGITVIMWQLEYKKVYKKWKQAENDYNDLLQEVARLTHENNILKSSNADTK